MQIKILYHFIKYRKKIPELLFSSTREGMYYVLEKISYMKFSELNKFIINHQV